MRARPVIYFLIEAFDWRAAALGSALLLAGIALPLAWLGARDPDNVSGGRQSPQRGFDIAWHRLRVCRRLL